MIENKVVKEKIRSCFLTGRGYSNLATYISIIIPDTSNINRQIYININDGYEFGEEVEFWACCCQLKYKFYVYPSSDIRDLKTYSKNYILENYDKYVTTSEEETEIAKILLTTN